jgi:tRNA(adenine34) deaminase
MDTYHQPGYQAPGSSPEIDRYYIREALIEAEKAGRLGEVPIGAVLVQENKIIARNHNRRETTGDPTAHAEILVLREASQHKRHWRLSGGTLYTTLEPCPMCAGAMVQARINRLVFGAYDPKGGAAGSLLNLLQDQRLNHWVEITAGILESECGKLLKEFFRERR